MKETRKTLIKTGVDRLMDLVNKEGRVTVKDASNKLGVSPETVEEWSKVLDKLGMLKLDYGFTHTTLISLKKEPEKTKRKTKTKKPRKKRVKTQRKAKKTTKKKDLISRIKSFFKNRKKKIIGRKKKFKCGRCGRKFSSHKGLSVHKTKKHKRSS